MEELSLWKILVLAVLQGVTEFLPVSSSGHLVIAMPLMCGGKTPEGMAGLNIVLHVGTLFSILIYYWQRIWQLFLKDRWTIVMVIIGTLPAVLIGLPVKMFAESVLESPFIAGVMLFVTGGLLLYLGSRPGGRVEYQQLTWRQALWIGLFQAAAILPGLSRSGATITCGVSQGLTRPSAATFSFLLALAAIAGGGVLEAKDIWKGAPIGNSPLNLLLGAGVAFGVGYVSLVGLNRWLEKGKLHYFAWYCFVLGAFVLLWQSSRLYAA